MLYEMLDEYKETNDAEIIKKFTDLLWNSKYKFKKYKKSYSYNVDKMALDNQRDLIDLFDKYKHISLTFCKSFYNKQLDYIDYIRIHINNMFGFLTDRDVYLPKKYYQLVLVPKREYLKTVKLIKNGKSVDYDEVKRKIEIALSESENIKGLAINKKIDLKWRDYKKLVNSYIERISNNYLPPHEYEKEHDWEMKVSKDGWSEDNYIVSYFCKSLTGYMINYVKNINKVVVPKRCLVCGVEIEVTSNSRKYCTNCGITKALEKYKRYNKKRKTYNHQ